MCALRSRSFLLALVCGLLLGSHSHAETVYSDTFSGTGGGIDGTTPASRGGVGTQAWIASPGLALSGSSSLVSTSRTGDFGGFLPFVPSAGYTYTFTLTIGADNTGQTNDNFAEFGFAKLAATSNQFDSPAVTGYAWWLQRNVAGLGGNNFAYGGPAGANRLNTDFIKTPTTRSIVLDTTQPQWTASFIRSGSTEASYTYASGQNPTDIAYIGLVSGFTTATFSNLTLTAVPEPRGLAAAAAAVGLTSWCVATRRKRRPS